MDTWLGIIKRELDKGEKVRRLYSVVAYTLFLTTLLFQVISLIWVGSDLEMDLLVWPGIIMVWSSWALDYICNRSREIVIAAAQIPGVTLPKEYRLEVFRVLKEWVDEVNREAVRRQEEEIEDGREEEKPKRLFRRLRMGRGKKMTRVRPPSHELLGLDISRTTLENVDKQVRGEIRDEKGRERKRGRGSDVYLLCDTLT